MRRIVTLFLVILFLFEVTSLHADPLINCDNGGSASLGDIKQQVRVSCGEPERMELLGYVDIIQNKERIRAMKIEEWIYSISKYGKRYYYSLIFEGNKLIEIKDAGSK